MTTLWQHPFVNVFKHFSVGSWKKSTKEGEVTTVMDRSLKCTVYKITGSIPAGNYVQLPKTSSQSLGLTGRFIYLMFKPIATKYFVVHVDVVTLDGLIVRVSFSNLFKEFKSTSTWLQFPFVCHAAKGTIYAATSVNSKDTAGPAPISSRWTLLSLDLPYILSMYLNRKYSYIKTIRLCASMMVKNVCTSDLVFEPGMTVDEVRKTGLSQQGVSPLPRELSYPLSKGEDWNDFYDVIRFPSDGAKKPFDSVQHSKSSPRRPRIGGRSPARSPSPGRPSPKRCPPRNVDTSRSVRQQQLAIDKMTTPKKSPHRKPLSELPTLVNRNGGAHVETDEDGGVHIYAHPEDEVVVCRESQKQTSQKLVTSKRPMKTLGKQAPNYTSLEPDPILRLRRVVGFGGETHREAHWSKDGRYIYYPCHGVVVAMEVATGGQQFYIGHTDKVSCLAITATGSHLASGQTGPQSVVRIWSTRSRHCLAMFKTHVHSVRALSYSPTGATLCGVGKDGHGKNMVVVWDTGHVGDGGAVTVLAKAHTEVDIVRMRISHFDDLRMVSCGRDNVRIWRVKDGALRSAPVDLREHHLMEFTDCCFLPQSDDKTTMDDGRVIFACSRSGHVFEIDYPTLCIKHVRRLMPTEKKSSEKMTFNGDIFTTHLLVIEAYFKRLYENDCAGLAINCISVSEAFCVTGTEDGYLRLWPLDFSQVYLEAEHEGPVTAVQMSDDGMTILAGTATGYLGTLDVPTRNYTTLLRSHTDRILSAAIDPSRRHLVTVARDNTIRVWDLDTMQQLYDFTATECPSAVCYHPSKQVFACGFESGTVRVFDVASTSLIAEFQQHRGSVTGLAYSPTGEHLYSSGSLGSLALYDSSCPDYAIVRVLGNVLARGEKFSPNGLVVSPDGFHVAYVGPTEFTVTVVNARSLDEVLRIDISTLPGENAVDTALRLSYSPINMRHLLVVTSSNRLLKLDARSGRLIAEVANIHRKSCSSLSASGNGKYLATCGDKVVKIWDYSMRLDLNFQVFIGHSEDVSDVMFTPDGMGLVSTGEAIYVWDFLAEPGAGPKGNECTEGRQSGVDYNSTMQTSPERSFLHSSSRPRDQLPRPTHQTTLPSVGDISSIHRLTIQDENDTEVARYTSHAQDEEEETIITVTPVGDDVIVTSNGRPVSSGVTSLMGDDEDVTIIHPGHVRERSPEPEPELVHQTGDLTIEWSAEPDRRLSQSPVKCYVSDVDTVTAATSHDKPDVVKHFVRRTKRANMAERYYTAPPEQAGLKLESVIGYNGNGRDNVIWHPDSGLFAYSCGCTVVLEDLSKGTQEILRGHVEEISCLALQNDSEVLASASGCLDNVPSQIILWCVESGQKKRTLNYHQSDVQCLSYSRDDRFLISVGDYRECALVIWSTYTHGLIANTKVAMPVHHVAWDPNVSNEFVTSGVDGSLTFWLVDEAGKQPVLKRHVATVPDEVTTTKKFTEKADFTCVSYSSDCIMYAGSSDGKVSAWDVNDNSCFMHWQADRCEIGHIVCGKDKMITSSILGSLRLWSVTGVRQIRDEPRRKVMKSGLTMEDEMKVDGCVTAVNFDDALELGIIATSLGTLWYVNWSTRTTIRLVSGHADKVNCVSMSDGKYLASCSDDGSLRLWTVESREQSLQFHVQGQACTSVAFATSPLDTKCPRIESTSYKLGQSPVRLHRNTSSPLPNLVAGYSDGTVRVFDPNKVEMITKLHPHACRVTAICYSSDGVMILSGASDGTLAVSSASTGMTVRVISEHRAQVGAAFAPITSIDAAPYLDDEGHLAVPQYWLAASADSRVSVWRSDWSRDYCELSDWLTFPAPAYRPEGGLISELDQCPYEDLPPSLAKFSRQDQDTIVYTGYGLERTVQFYSLKHRQVMRTCPITDWASSMDVSPSSGIVALGSNDRLVRLMDYYEGTFQDFTSHQDAVHCLKFSPDGASLFTVARNEIFVWQVMV